MHNMFINYWKPVLIMPLMLLMLVFAAPAMASCDGLSVSGLTDAQIIDLKKACVEATAKAAVAPPVTATDLSQYAELGQKYGIALSEVAKSVGTTVNELAQTPVGIFMLVMVGWKVMGHDLLGVVGGTAWFLTMLPLWILFFNRMVFNDRRIDSTFDPNTGKLLERKVYPIKYEDGPGPIASVMLIVLVVICIAGFVMVF